MADPAPDGDPIAEEAKRAREDPDPSLLPSSDGLGPGAGETPAADVTAGSSSRQDAAPDVTSAPSIGAPPRRTERPDFRSSQLDGAPEEEEDAER
ncbi:MAG: hypothetical protein M3Z57_04855 [Candidatus Dormibacteraeota bacterium]|nr:hypothetical protein [Candidatus Dormibacteraeota bacterium]